MIVCFCPPQRVLSYFLSSDCFYGDAKLFILHSAPIFRVSCIIPERVKTSAEYGINLLLSTIFVSVPINDMITQ